MNKNAQTKSEKWNALENVQDPVADTPQKVGCLFCETWTPN